jgi:response regulator RpfG family c-di-GMP phosphodiesterase
MSDEVKPRILCVDDEERVLAGLRVILRQSFDVVLETQPKVALARVQGGDKFAVVISDMRMPEMNGAELLAGIREASPDTTRMLLTGFAEVDAAVAAINDGQVFRFLVKPCPPPLLREACRTALRQHELVTGERVLLEQTLRGAIATLTELLGMASPKAFGRAQRLRRMAAALARRVHHPEPWSVEVAAMLSQIGQITLDEEVIQKLYRGQPLDAAEEAQVERLPTMVDSLLANIPRLERIRSMVLGAHRPIGNADEAVRVGAAILDVVLRFDTIAIPGGNPADAVAKVCAERPKLDPALAEALRTTVAELYEAGIARLKVGELRPGMVLASDVVTVHGALLLTRGQEVTAALVERLRAYRGGPFQEPILVIASPQSLDKAVGT